MFRRIRRSKGFRIATYLTGMLQFAFPPYAVAQGNGPQIVLDGRTDTSLSINQNVTDVYTNTVLGGTGFNSFSIFNVYEGNEVNLFLPDGASALMNMVHDQQTVIDGYLNAYKDGKIGGDVYFLNPHGIIVGKSGVMNVGSARLMAPTQDFMANMFGANGMINAPQVTRVKDSNVALSTHGLISVRGRLNTTGTTEIAAADIAISGTIETGTQAVVSIDNLVNLQGTGLSGEMIDLSSVEAGIALRADDDVTITGRLGADGTDNQDAGTIDVRAGDDIAVLAGADLSADGRGANSDGGTVITFADDTAILGRGARLSADGGTSGDGGFVEFSASRLVELAGGRLSAAAQDGTDGAVLIDPDDIIVSADLLRDTTTDGGSGDADNNTSWNAGSLTLQAANSITIADNITVSSRRVSAANDASAHRTANSIASSGDITFQSDNITLGAGSLVTSKATGSFDAGDITIDGRIVIANDGAEIDASTSGSGNAGTILIDVDDRDNASIRLAGASLRAGNVTLDADAAFTPGGVYDNPEAVANSEIILTDGTALIASDDISITADATQNKHAYSGGVLVQFDARRAASAIDLRGATLTASDDITIASASTIQTDMSPTGWSSLASLLPLNVSVAVTYSTSDILIDGASNITASGALNVNADALTQSTILSQSNSAGAALVAAVSATENRATLQVGDDASLSGKQGVTLKTKGKTQVTAIADASAGSIASLSGAIAIGIGIVRDNTSTVISDEASISSASGDIAVLADSQAQTVFAARAANDDNFTATVQSKFDAGIDDTPALNQTFLGFNLADFLKSEVADQISTVTSQMDASNQDGGGIQLSGALTFSDVQNDTEAYVIGTGANAPSLTASNGAIDIKARAITQTQGFASGRTDNGSVGGSAGISIQLVENRLTAKAEGTDSANVNLTSDNLTIAALTQAYEDNVSDMNKYSIFASSGVGNDGDNDEVGIAGAIAVQISNVNDVTAEIGDNVSVTVADNVNVTASNNTEVKVKADGSKGAQAASDEFFAVLDNNTPSEQFVKTNSTSGKLGIGASLAFAVTENDVIARVDGGALFSGTDNLSVTASQISTTESEARSSGSGGIALVPVAAISVARNNALALIDSGTSTLTLADKASISSTQDVLTSSIGNGAADTGGDSTIQVAVGLSAGIAISFDNNSARLSRDLSVAGGLDIAALTSHDIKSGAQSSAEKIDPELIEDSDEEESDSDENTADNATNNSTTDTVDSLLGTTDGQSGKVVNADAIKNKLNTNFSNVSGGDTPVGGPESTGDNEGKSVAIAGAFGVTYAESDAVAEIENGVTVNAGSDNISISSLKNTDMTSTGDASTGGSDVNVGGGVGLNIAKSNNRALIGDEAVVSASGLSVVAGMRSQLADDNSTDVTNVITATATSGSGTGEVAIAGSVALNVVLENNATAAIGDNVSLTLAGGDVAVEATATSTYDASSTATVGKTNALFAGIDAALSGLQDITVWTSSIAKNFTNLTTSAINKAYSEGELFQDPSEGGGDSEESGGGDEGGFGLGAGISINAVIAENTKAVIEDNVTFDGTGRSDSVRVAATATTNTNTKAFAGAKPGAGNDPDAKTSLDAAVAVSVVMKNVDARLGSASTIQTNGDVDVISTANTISQSTAKGEVTASSTAVGASVAVGVVLETNEAVLNSNLNLANGGGLTVQADTNATDIVLADATAAGAALDKYSNKLGISKSDLLGSSRAGSSDGDSPTSMSALNGDFTGGQGADFDTTGDKTATPNGEAGESKQSGSINIAASVAANWADHSARADIADNLSITTAGDVLVEATNDANYRTRGSGMSVFADKSIGVGVGLLKTGQVTKAEIGENVGINAGASDVNVRAITSENQGTDPDNSSINFGGYASAEGIAGAGGGELGVAGSLGLTFSYDTQSARIGKNVTISSARNVGVVSQATNKIVTRAWAMALASDATCSDPGNCGSSSGDKTAVGASIAVNIVIDNNTAEIGENVDISAATDNVSVVAKDLKPSNAEFLLDPSDNTTNTEDYLQANYTATLQNSSYYAEAIAGGAAQNGNAGTGSLAVTVSVGKTQALVGEGVEVGGENFTVTAFNSSDARHVVGAVALADKKAIGASISGIYLREDVRAIIANDSDSGAADNVSVDISGDMAVTATADQNALTIMAAGGVSSNDLALAGAFGFNVLDTDVEARIRRNADITSTGGSVSVNATSLTDIQNFAIAVAGSGGSNSVGGTLALNLFLTDKKAIVGDNASSDNNIQITAANDIDVGVDAKQEIMNGVISASVSTSSNAVSGALSSNIVKGDSFALVQEGADLNTDTSVSSTTQAVSVTAVDNTTITDLTGTLAASSSTSVGVALGANVFWKDVQAGVNSTVNADDNVIITADTVQNLTATVVGIAGSSGGLSGAGSVSVGLVKSTTEATIGSDAVIDTDGSVQLHAGDDTDIFMLEPAASFSSGGTALAGAVGAAVFVGTTRARVLSNATISARGNETIAVDTKDTVTTSPLLSGITGGGDNETRDALADFNDNFTFDNIKDLFLTETRTTETKRGVSVTAVQDQDVISIAASGAVSSDTAIAISLSAGVGVGTTEASIATGAEVNNDISSANANQDVTLRALSDTYWVDLSAALGVGTGSAGVGVGADVVVQVKDTSAYIGTGASVKAKNDIEVFASAKDKVINSAATIGVGSTAGVAGTASVAVMNNNITAYIDGTAQADGDMTVRAKAQSDLVQIAGAVGGGGTAGIGASFGVAVIKNTTRAYIGQNANTDAKLTTTVDADADETSVAAVLAGGVGGTVGVSVAAGIKVHKSDSKAFIQGNVNQVFNDNSTAQNVVVSASNDVTTIDVTGGIGGGGTVGVGVTLNALTVHNKAQAYIDGTVSAADNIDVIAESNKTTKNFTLAGAAGGTVSVAGNVAVVLVGAQADEETDSQMTGSGDNNLAQDADNRNNSLIVSNILNDDNSSGDYGRTGTAYSDVGTEIDAKQSETNIASSFEDTNNAGSLNQTKAYISNNATVRAGDNITVSATDTTNSIFTAGAVGGAGVVGVGVTVGVMLVNNTAEAFIGENADVYAGRNLTIRARTTESVNSGAISAGGAGITSVQGVVMAQVTKSTTRAYIADNASINSDNYTSADQNVAVEATSDTSLLSVSGSGGGALVGVGITGDAVVLEKQTTAYIGDNANVYAGGDVSVDADAEADIIQVALSINGGLVGVTGAAGIVVAKNETKALIGSNAVVYARDSVRLEARDDTEIDAIVVAGAGGAVGVSGAFGTYIFKSVTEAAVDNDTAITALATGGGLAAANGVIDNSSTSITSKATRDQDNNTKTDNFTVVDAQFGTDTKRGLSIAAVTNEDVNFAPVGLGFGAVGVAGVVATTVANSTTRAKVGGNVTINDDLTGASSAQDVSLLAKSNTQLNNISSGISAGGVAVSLDIDTQVFTKTVEAIVGDNVTIKANQNIDIKADSTDRIYQTMVSVAGGANAVGGIVGVSVIGDTVRAEIGDDVTVRAGDNMTVQSDQEMHLIQSAGNIAVGFGGAGIGTSLGVLVAKSSNTAKIGDNADLAVRDALAVRANTDTNLNQNIIGFAGDPSLAISGSLGINILKTSTVAEIGDNAEINQIASYNDVSSQSISVIANDNVTTQAAGGAAAFAGGAGVGIGVVATVTRNTVKARLGNNLLASAQGDVTVKADSSKDIANQGIAAAGGLGLGAAGSMALTLIGGSMSDNASQNLSNDNGDMVAEAASDAGENRGNYDNDSAKSNTRAYTEADDNETLTLVEAQTSGIDNDINGSDGDSTLAEIGSGAQITANGAVRVEAEETLKLSQISGGAAIGAVGVGGYVAVADYAGSVTARIGDNSRIDNTTGVTVDAIIQSGDGISVDLPEGDSVGVEGVHSVVVGASVGIAGLAASIAQVNLVENVRAEIGDNVTINTADNTADITVQSERDIDADVLVAALAGGAVAAGISVVDVNASGDALALVGDNSRFGSSTNQVGDVLISARNESSHTSKSVSAGIAYAGAVVGAFVNISDEGLTKSEIGDNTAIYSGRTVQVTTLENTSNDVDSLGVALAAGVGLSGVFTDVDVTRDSEIAINDNVTITGNDITVQASAGDGVTEAANNYSVAAGGGLLIGANATKSDSDIDIDTSISIGTNATITDAGTTRIATNNRIKGQSRTKGFSGGIAAVGANFAYHDDTSDSQIAIGSGLTLDTAEHVTIEAYSAKEALTDTLAGAGGAIAATGGEAKTTVTTVTRVALADSQAGARASITAGDNATIKALNEDEFDHAIDASNVGGVSISAGKAVSTGTSDVDVALGNYVDISAENIFLNATNNMAKTGVNSPNFALRGGGALSVAIGVSRGVLTQNTDVTIGEQNRLTSTGTSSARSTTQITAFSGLAIDDEAETNVGGAISVPRSDSKATGVANTTIRFEDNASLTTNWGNVVIEAQSAPTVDIRAFTSTYGLVGAGAEARAVANITKVDNVIFETNANTNVDGTMDIYAGRLATAYYQDHRIDTESRIWNNTAIPIDSGRQSDITFSNNARIDIQSGASLKSTKDIQLMATRLQAAETLGLDRDYLLVKSYGEAKNLYQAGAEAITGGNYSDFYGSETTTGVAGVSVAGTVETGIKKDVSVTINAAMTDYYVDNGTTQRYTIQFDNASDNPSNKWVLIDPRIVDQNIQLEADGDNDSRTSPIVGYLDDNITVSNASWTIDPEVDFAANVRSEIAALRDVLNAYPEGSTDYDEDIDNGSETTTVTTSSSYSTDQLTAMRNEVQSRITVLESSIALYGSEPVPVIKISDIEAATGDVKVVSDYLSGGGTINTPSGETVTITNNSPIALVVNDIDIPDVGGGNIVFNGVTVTTGAEVDAINGNNLPTGQTQGLTLVSGENSADPSVTINNNFDSANSAYNPDGISDITAPAIALRTQSSDGYGGIRNIRGSVTVNNETGSIFSQASLAAKTVDISSGGNYVFDADVNVFHVGGDPRNNTQFASPTGASHSDTISDYNSGNGVNTISEMDNRAFTGGCDPLRKEITGLTYRDGYTWLDAFTASLGGQSTAHMYEPTFTEHPSTCGGVFASASNTNASSVIAASNDVFISANNLNINGLIQAGITNKTISISQSEVNSAIASNPNDNIVTVKSVNKTLEGSIVGNTDNRYVSGDIKLKYDREKDELFVTTADVKGGNLTVAGRIISTGNGKLVAADGYGQISITNNSDKKLSLTNLSTGGMEGKITIVDSLRDNGLGSSLITEYTRNQGTLTVTNNQGSSSVNNVVSSPSYSYSPESGARFNFMSGQQTVDRETEYRTKTTKRLWGVSAFDVGNDFWSGQAVDNVETATLSGEQLPEGDYIDVDTSDSSEYTFKADQIETDRTLVHDESGTDRCWWGGFLNMVRYCRYYNTTAYVVGSLRYNYHSLRADNDIAIGFSGDENGGSISVTSNGGVVISGQINNEDGTTSITASNGDIVNASETDSISTGNLTLAATTGSIGTAANPIRIAQSESDNLTISAGQNVNVASPAGSLYINSISVGGTGAIRLQANQNVELKGTGVLTGHTIDIVAEEGTATSAGGIFRVNTDADNGGTLSIASGGGNINVQETTGDLRVKQLITSDNITVTVVDGDLLDGNSEQVDDEIAIADLNALVDQMGLTGTAAQTKKQNTIDTYKEQVENLYNDYFALRNITTNDDNTTSWDAYDANFSYTATASERSALNDNATRIANFEASQQTRYQAGYEKFGDPTTYSDNYTYVVTADERDSITNGFEWTEDQLNNKIPVIEFKEVADTTLAIESTNLSGNTITLNVDNGSVGRLTHNFTVDLFSEGNADHNINNLDNTTRLALAAAESEDAIYDNETGIMTISMFEDFDVSATGNVSISAQDVIYLGSETNTLIERADAGGDVRIKMDGNLLNGRSDNSTVVSGQNILLESGKGRIGASDKQFVVDVDNGSILSGRSRDGIYVTEATGDVNVGSFYSKAAINLISPGGIFDSALDTTTDIKGLDVSLTAQNAIGQQPADGDSDAVKKNKALDVATINDDNATFTITSATDGAWLYTDFGQPMRLTGADINGDLDMAVASALKVVGSLDTNGGTVTLRSFESLNLEGVGGIDTNGALLNLSSGDNMALSGSISTGGGDIMAVVGDNFSTAENTSLTTGGGNLAIDADALADSLGYQNVTIGDGSVINLGAGSLTVDASDTVTLTGIVTDNVTTNAIVINATSIQDGGNSNADITLNGNGDIRLNVHAYANLNKIDYNGSSPLELYIQGKNEGARAVGTMLGIEAEAGISVEKLIANSAAFDAPLSDKFDIVEGRLRDDAFISAGLFDARIGRLRDNMLTPNEWLLSANDNDYFTDGALLQGIRDEDYRCTGAPSFIGNDNAILDVTFTYDNPYVNCSGVLSFYRLPYVLQAPVQSIENQLSNVIENIRLSGSVEINPVSATRLEQAILSTDRSGLILSEGLTPEVVIAQDAQIMGISDNQVAEDLAQTFGVRRSSATGVVQVDITDIIQIGLPLGTQPVEDDEAEEDQAPTEEADADEDTAPLAANGTGETQIGPLSLLLN